MENSINLLVKTEPRIQLITRRTIKRKVLGMPVITLLLGILLISLVTAGVMVYKNIMVNISVQDPFSMVSDIPSSISLSGGEVNNYSLTTFNNARVDLNQTLILKVTDLSNNLLDNNRVKITLDNLNKSIVTNSLTGTLSEVDNQLNKNGMNTYQVILQFSPEVNGTYQLNVTQNKGAFSFR